MRTETVSAYSREGSSEEVLSGDERNLALSYIARRRLELTELIDIYRDDQEATAQFKSELERLTQDEYALTQDGLKEALNISTEHLSRLASAQQACEENSSD